MKKLVLILMSIYFFTAPVFSEEIPGVLIKKSSPTWHPYGSAYYLVNESNEVGTTSMRFEWEDYQLKNNDLLKQLGLHSSNNLRMNNQERSYQYLNHYSPWALGATIIAALLIPDKQAKGDAVQQILRSGSKRIGPDIPCKYEATATYSDDLRCRLGRPLP